MQEWSILWLRYSAYVCIVANREWWHMRRELRSTCEGRSILLRRSYVMLFSSMDRITPFSLPIEKAFVKIKWREASFVTRNNANVVWRDVELLFLLNLASEPGWSSENLERCHALDWSFFGVDQKMNPDFRGSRLDLSALLVGKNRCHNNLNMACCGIGWWSMNRLNKLTVCCIDGTLNYLLILSRSALHLTCHWYCCNSRRVVGLTTAVVLICSIDIVIFSKSQRLCCWLQLEDFY